MAKQTIKDLDLKGKKVLVRVDFNVPQDDSGAISDDRRIRAALPTLQFALDHGASLILVSHLGRPSGDPASDEPFRLTPVAARLGELLGRTVVKADDTVGPDAQAKAAALKPGEVLVLENVRFNKGEKVPKDEKSQAKHDEFAKQLASLADCYVNDAFGTCHRDEASMLAVPSNFAPEKRAIGFLVEKELSILEQLLGKPKHPMLAVMGGAKVSDKIKVIKNLLPQVDRLLIGGAMSYTFLKAMGHDIGTSKLDEPGVAVAKELLEANPDKIELPTDFVVATQFDGSDAKVIEGRDIEAPWGGFDIGPKTLANYRDQIQKAATVVWNGPVGMFEAEPFSKGTRGISQALADSKAITVVGGGESAEAVEKFGYAGDVDHVSTGGGAFLESLEGREFNSLKIIPEKG